MTFCCRTMHHKERLAAHHGALPEYIVLCFCVVSQNLRCPCFNLCCITVCDSAHDIFVCVPFPPSPPFVCQENQQKYTFCDVWFLFLTLPFGTTESRVYFQHYWTRRCPFSGHLKVIWQESVIPLSCFFLFARLKQTFPFTLTHECGQFVLIIWYIWYFASYPGNMSSQCASSFPFCLMDVCQLFQNYSATRDWYVFIHESQALNKQQTFLFITLSLTAIQFRAIIFRNRRLCYRK